MPTLKIQFPGGRYHATPWGHHVNEGLIEWPPSPWRLLRAFVACGFSSQGWTDVPLIAKQLIYKLAGALPLYHLPQASAAHTRHFMPVGKLEKGREKTTLVFDTFASIGNGELLIHWPCELSEEETTLLETLANSLSYLGRSESWVEAKTIPGEQIDPRLFNAFPHCEGAHPGIQFEQLSLIAAIAPAEYTRWHEEVTKTVLAKLPLPDEKKKQTAKLLKDRQKAVDPYPPDLLSCLMKDTAWWKGHGWSQPPGSQRVLYWRRADALQIGAPNRTIRCPARPVSAVLLAMTTPTGNRSALPHISRTLPQAELLHAALVSRAGNGQQISCPELTGKDTHNIPLRDHQHSHVFPLDLDGDSHIDHILIYAPMCMGDKAQRAIGGLKRTWTKGGVGELQLAIVGEGTLHDFRRLPAPLRHGVEQLVGPEEGSCHWISVTPFVPPRHLKQRGKNTLIGQINDELVSRKLPAVQSITVLPWQSSNLTLRHYVRRRQRGGAPPPMDIGFALQLNFSESVRGPLALGYASHFGLGLFAATPSGD